MGTASSGMVNTGVEGTVKPKEDRALTWWIGVRRTDFLVSIGVGDGELRGFGLSLDPFRGRCGCALLVGWL